MFKYFWPLIIILGFVILWFFSSGESKFIGAEPFFNGEEDIFNSGLIPISDSNKVNSNKVNSNKVEEIKTSDDEENVKEIVEDNKVQFIPGRRWKSEAHCQDILEQIFELPFTKARPDFLKNPETGRNLELDCYNEKLKLALEYNGEQHYNWPNFLNQSEDEFIKQLRRDEFKIRACNENGIYIIIVPYTVHKDDRYRYILERIPHSLKSYIKVKF